MRRAIGAMRAAVLLPQVVEHPVAAVEEHPVAAVEDGPVEDGEQGIEKNKG